MDMIPKKVILTLIDELLKIDAAAMEDIITKDKVSPHRADMMRLTYDKSKALVNTMRKAIVKLPIITQTEGMDMPTNDKYDILRDEQKDIKKRIVFLYNTVKELSKLMEKASELSIKEGKLLQAFAERVESLEKQLNITERKN